MSKMKLVTPPLVLIALLLSLLKSPHAEEVITTKELSESEIRSIVSSDVISLEGVQIRGNKELPSILYIVPWQEIESRRQARKHEIILHSLSERRIRPIMPDLLEQGVK